MHCLAEHAPKSIKDRFTKPCRLILRDLRERAKIISKLLFLTRRHVLRKNQKALLNKKTVKKPNIWFWVNCLAKHDPKCAKDQFIKLCRLIPGGIREEAKINFKIPCLIRRQVLSKNQRALSIREKSKNVLSLILGALFGKARPKICSTSIYQTLLDDFRIH